MVHVKEENESTMEEEGEKDEAQEIVESTRVLQEYGPRKK